MTANKNGIQVFEQLHSAPETEFIIDFYAASADDPLGNGEGERWLGSQTITSGDEGVGEIRYDISLESAAVGEFITMTATNPSTGDTSESSTAVLIVERGGGGVPPMLFTAYEVEDSAILTCWMNWHWQQCCNAGVGFPIPAVM